MILILSTARDEHAQRVLVELTKLGAKAQLVDLAEFPQRLPLSMRYADRSHCFRFGCDQTGLDLDDCGAVWWRRPQPVEISPAITSPEYRQFAYCECNEALHGLWHALDAYWINDPARDSVAQRKPFQLRVAQEVGLEIPQTLITNCPTEVLAFANQRGVGRTVFKAFSGTERHWRETRILRDDALAVLDSVRYAPVIFQEYIEAQADLRITVIGEDVFAAAIYSQDTAYQFDFRMDIGRARVEAAELPANVRQPLLALMRKLGLVYGAIDMRRTPDGRHVFLEINPAGQWLFIEDRTGQPATAALARLLQSHDR